MSSNSPQLPRTQVLLDQQLDEPFGNPHIYREVHKPGEASYKGTAALFTFFFVLFTEIVCGYICPCIPPPVNMGFSFVITW